MIQQRQWKGILFLIPTLVLMNYALAQKPSARVMPLSERELIEKSQTDYASAVRIADSVYAVYDQQHFIVKTEEEMRYVDGLSFVASLYSKAWKLADDRTYCEKQLKKIKEQSDQELLIEVEKQYQKILTKADEYYAAGDLSKCIELYERAARLKPSDKAVKKRLKVLKEEQVGTAKQ